MSELAACYWRFYVCELACILYWLWYKERRIQTDVTPAVATSQSDLLTQASIMSLAISLSLCSRCLANSGSGQWRSSTNICRASSFQNRSSEVAEPLLQGGWRQVNITNTTTIPTFTWTGRVVRHDSVFVPPDHNMAALIVLTMWYIFKNNSESTLMPVARRLASLPLLEMSTFYVLLCVISFWNFKVNICLFLGDTFFYVFINEACECRLWFFGGRDPADVLFLYIRRCKWCWFALKSWQAVVKVIAFSSEKWIHDKPFQNTPSLQLKRNICKFFFKYASVISNKFPGKR